LPGARKFVELGVHARSEIEQLEPLESLPRTVVDPRSDDDDEATDNTLQ
jgi:hypothetical protein